MSKKILYLEDNGYLLEATVSQLEEDNFEVISFSRIDLAINYLQNESSVIDCIITDLNMDDEWLEEHRAESNGGLLAGWVWLRYHVYTMERFQNIPCVIYSGYIEDLKRFLNERKEYGLLNQYPISCVQKGGNDCEGYTELINKLREIFAEKEKREP